MLPAIKIKEILKNLPVTPGVYLMQDRAGTVLYVGKAKSLRSRVSSYFLKTNELHPKISAMLESLQELQYIVTDSELEALILESNLIKKYLPRYNVLLKDDKHYPYIRININHEFPSIEVVRKKADDGARYFGPFPNSGIIKPSLKFITRYFPVRVCQGELSQNKPCLNFQIKRCLGPCTEKVDRSVYHQYVHEVVLFLEGKYERLKSDMEILMKRYAAAQLFEQAAVYRDRLFSLRKITQRQKIILESNENLDVIAYELGEKYIYLCLMVYREGYLLNQYNYQIDLGSIGSDEDLLSQGFIQHYARTESWPNELLLPEGLKPFRALQQDLQLYFGGKVGLKFPQIGMKYNLLNMAAKNVRKYTQSRVFSPRDLRVSEMLRDVLGLKSTPVSIVAFDISHLAGTSTVASAVYFENGRPQKKFYKRFAIRSVTDKPDDYQSMLEVVTRYFARFPMVDLILVDGGRGQVAKALEALTKLGVTYPALIGLAKSEEAIILSGRTQPLLLQKRSPALQLLQQVRDEAHRFAITYQKKTRMRIATRSEMDEIPGVSRVRRNKLLFYFGSLEAVKKASLDDIINVPGFGKKLALKIYNVFH